jgi:hypothetical protein
MRTRWNYTPTVRPGACLADLDRTGRKAAHQLLASAVSFHSFAEITTIMGLEEVLDHAEGSARGRHSNDYWVAVFGDPTDRVWSWRFEGHHVSVTMTIAEDEVTPTPLFLGANPAVVRYGDTPVIRPLALEEELARGILAELPRDQLTTAMVNDRAPRDILSAAAVQFTDPLDPPGISGAELKGTAADLLDRLLNRYLDRMHPDLAAIEAQDLSADVVHFAWEGPPDPGFGHYYRIQGPSLLIEYDNTQNSANHIHSVLRRPGDDFGANLLAAHHATERN